MKAIRFLVATLGVALMYSCESARDADINRQHELSEELKGSIRRYFENDISKHGENVKIMDVTISKVDTLTPLLDSMYTMQFVAQKADLLLDESLNLLSLAQESMDLALRSATVGSRLAGTAKSDAVRAQDQALDAVARSKAAGARVYALDSLIRNQLIDSTTMTGYLVNFNIKAVNGSNVAQDLDGKSLIFDLDKRIVLKPEQRELM